jgi:hypothetical protein
MKKYEIRYCDGEVKQGNFESYLAAYLYAMENLNGRTYLFSIVEIS